MNNVEKQEKMWPNNGKIMLEMNDYDLNLYEERNGYSLFKNFVIVNTIHEDELEWEKDFVLGDIVISETKDKHHQNLSHFSKDLNLLGTEKVPLKATNRIALTEDFDLVATEDTETFIELNNSNCAYTYMSLSILANYSKTHIKFLIMLL